MNDETQLDLEALQKKMGLSDEDLVIIEKQLDAGISPETVMQQLNVDTTKGVFGNIKRIPATDKRPDYRGREKLIRESQEAAAKKNKNEGHNR